MSEFENFKIWQSHLGALLGLSIEELRRRRKKCLVEGVDWIRDGNRVLLTDEAVQKIRAECALPEPLPGPEKSADQHEAAPGQKNGAGGGLSREPLRLGPGLRLQTELVVYRTVMNRQVLEAHEEGADPSDRRNLVRVRVRDSVNFVRGMRVRVRFVQEPDLFEHVGRLPRWKGKY